MDTSTTAQFPQVVNLFADFFDPASGKSWTGCYMAQPFEAPVSTLVPLIRLNEAAREEDVQADPRWRLRGVLERLNAMERLGPNWDSYESQPPSADARSKARDLIWDVVGQFFGTVDLHAIPFTVVPLSGGGVQVEWRGANNSIEVEVGPCDRFGYLLAKGHGPNREFEERDNVSEHDVVRQVAAALS